MVKVNAHGGPDILTEMETRVPAKTPRAKRMAWVVSLGNGRLSNPRTYRQARKLAARYNKMFRSKDAYAVRFGIV